MMTFLFAYPAVLLRAVLACSPLFPPRSSAGIAVARWSGDVRTAPGWYGHLRGRCKRNDSPS
jgi:hypothetical protein